ncbi:MAG: Crp/Fnr family transcriptional regulator [Bacteroidales bacterium]
MRTTCNICHFHACPAVKKLGLKEQNLLADNTTEIKYKKGNIIFMQNAFANNVGYLTSGLVKKHMTGLNGKEQIIEIIKAPSFIGIPTTMGNHINQYSVTSLTESSMCMIDLNIFKKICCENAPFACEMIQEMCRKELNHFCSCFNKTQKNAKGLVADTLVYFACSVFNTNSFSLPLSRSEIADLINTSREQVCRILSEFHNDGIIKIKGKEVSILNSELLEKISQNG